MPGTVWTDLGRRGRRRSMLLAGFGFAMAACGSPNAATPVSTYVPTAVIRSALPDAPLGVGQAATGTVVGPNGADRTLTVGLAANDTFGGLIPDEQLISPFDVDNPAMSRLDPLLRKAIQDAARHAQDSGVAMGITSGWRSKGFQQRLFDDAVGTYGSVAKAAEYVASPDVSKHVLGEAVDVGPVAADEWLARNGAQFGLCQIYANEIWHFELVADGQGHCPPLQANAAG